MLELHFGFTVSEESREQNPYLADGNFLAYVFEFKNGKWKVDKYDPFVETYKKVQHGKIVNPFMEI